MVTLVPLSALVSPRSSGYPGPAGIPAVDGVREVEWMEHDPRLGDSQCEAGETMPDFAHEDTKQVGKDRRSPQEQRGPGNRISRRDCESR